MSDDPDDTREQGIEFGSLAEELETEQFPLSHEELLSRYGDHELELVDKQTTLREVLGAGNERTFEDVDGVRQAIFNMVGEEAVGREAYSDRGGNASELSDKGSDESF